MITMRRVVTTVLAAAAVAALVVAFSGPPRQGNPRPAAVESVYPEGGDLDLHQVRVMADLASGYTGMLRIDGEEVVADDVQFVDALNQLILKPQPDSRFAHLEAGRHRVTVVYWPIGEPDRKSSYTWSFSLH